MSELESQQGSEGEHNVKVLKDDYRYGATLYFYEGEDFEVKKVYTPLRLLVKRTLRLADHPPMAARRSDRVMFFRAYATAASKSYFICWRKGLVSNLVYMGVFLNSLLACLAVYFIQIFLGVYATAHHLYITKMVPLFIGISVMYFFTAILELSRFTDLVMIYLDYFFAAVFLSLPWNSCENEDTKLEVLYRDRSYSFRCLTLPEFMAAHNNESAVVMRAAGRFTCYIHEGMGTCNQISQLVFITKRDMDMKKMPFSVLGYFVLIWASCVLWHKQVFRTGLYKLMKITQVIAHVFFLFFFIHVKFVAEKPAPPKPNMESIIDKEAEWSWLMWDLSEAVVAALAISPPMLHLMAARCEKVKPNSESFVLTVETLLLLVFRAWINMQVHAHIDGLFNGFNLDCVDDSAFVYPCLYYWLIFFASLHLGNFYCLVFLAVNLVTEYLTMIVMLHCFVEIYVSTFKFFKKTLFISLVSLLSLCLYMFVSDERRLLAHLCRVIVFTMECVAIFAIYPFRRLLDDLTFYYGVHPSKIRYLSTLIVPLTQFVILASLVLYTPADLGKKNKSQLVIYGLLLLFMALPLLGGAAYTIVRFMQDNPGDLHQWTQLFCPAREWGPTNFIARQLRKQFDSHEFVASQAPRILSRYLMKNAEPESYKLDIMYETNLEPTAGSDQKKFS